jgi:DNA-binding LytR/AlgR family response regulator
VSAEIRVTGAPRQEVLRLLRQHSYYYATLFVSRKTYDVRETMQALIEKLELRDFVPIHRSTIVNVHRVREIRPWFSRQSHRTFAKRRRTAHVALPAGSRRTPPGQPRLILQQRRTASP